LYKLFATRADLRLFSGGTRISMQTRNFMHSYMIRETSLNFYGTSQSRLTTLYKLQA
jgi:hypothetical protein